MRVHTRLLVGLIITVFIASHVVGPVLANENRMDDQKNKEDEGYFSEERYSYFEQEGYDEKHHCRLPVPESFSTTVDLTIDKTLIEATPHWVLLAAGKTEQEALLNYIKQADVSKNKKSQWTRFMMKVWMKYPVKYIKKDGSSRLVPGGKFSKFSLTKQEGSTFREIELYIANDMNKESPSTSSTAPSSQIMPQWAPDDHYNFVGIVLRKDGIPSDFIIIGENSAKVPDDKSNYWDDRTPIPYSHQINHGYVPTSIPLTGLAPSNTGENASYAKTNFQLHHYVTAFENLGYASHFMQDLGNPYHTPMVQIIPLIFIDDPLFSSVVGSYEKLHNKYEEFLTTHWAHPLQSGETFESIAYSVNDYTIITDPEAAAKNLALTSWAENPLLVYACFWHHLMNGNYEFEGNPVITSITKDRVIQTEKNTWGLVRYVTGGQPLTISITATVGPGGTITPSGTISVGYGTTHAYTITANPGYVIDDVKIDENSVGGSNQKSLSQTVLAVLSDHIITATFKRESPPEGVTPLCQAGTPFDALKYPQNTLQSVPMEFGCSWDGTGRVFISGDRSSLTGIYADDGFTMTIQPSKASFDAQPHRAGQHQILELTSGMTPGENAFTLVVQNWWGLSMSYGSSTGYGTDQTPYIVRVNYPADTALPAQIEQTPFIGNESEKEG
jgi:hypothetical protein